MDLADSNQVAVLRNRRKKTSPKTVKQQTLQRKPSQRRKRSGHFKENSTKRQTRAQSMEERRVLRSNVAGITALNRVTNVKTRGVTTSRKSPGEGSTSKRVKMSGRVKRNSRRQTPRNSRASVRSTIANGNVTRNKKSRKKTTSIQSSRRQRNSRCTAGTSEQRRTRSIRSSAVIREMRVSPEARAAPRRNETVTTREESIEGREPSTAEAVNIEAVLIEREDTEPSEDVEDVENSDGMLTDARMARREFMREMELVGREIGRLVEVVGRDFIREMAEVERDDRDTSRDQRDATREFHVVLRDARRMLEERVTDIANQMIVNVSNASRHNNDMSRSELWSRATSVLRDARHSEELGTWIADAILGVGLGGLSEASINRLPTWNYSSAASRRVSSAGGSNRSVSRKCQICLSGYKGGNLIRTLPCFHDFHAACVDKWLKSSRTCPTCRFEISFDDE